MSIYVGEKISEIMDEEYYERFAEVIDSFVKEEKDVHVISYCFSEDSEFKMLHIIKSILNLVGKSNLENTLYSCVKELVINGAKANIKRLFFEVNNYDITDKTQYETGLKAFKKSISEEMFIEYGKIASDRGLFVKSSFFYNQDGLRIEVTNNTPIEYREERRIRQKLELADKYKNLLDFFSENEDNEEGAGLGIALIIFLLKGEGFDSSLFRIFIKDKITTARIELPFTDKFVSIRESHGKH